MDGEDGVEFGTSPLPEHSKEQKIGCIELHGASTGGDPAGTSQELSVSN
jgi:hypothetical protein